MIPSTPQNPKATALVMWVIWFAISIGLFIQHEFAAPKPVPAEQALPLSLSMMSFIALGLAAAGMIVRLLIIPRINPLPAKIPVMVIGLALSEACGIMGMFVTPMNHTDERTLLFIVAVTCVILSAPIYAKAPRKDDGFHVQP